MPRFAIRVVMCLLLVAGTSALGAQSSPTPYGAPVTTDAAKRATAAAMAVARANNWTIAVAIVDGSGVLVYFERMDATPNGSSVIAAEKARSAALFKRPTKSFQDVLTAGGEGLRILRLEGAVPIEGGLPLVIGGKIVGAIGVSGATSAQDGQAAHAGAQAVLTTTSN